MDTADLRCVTHEPLTVAALFAESQELARDQYLCAKHDGKSIGTFIENELCSRLKDRFTFVRGNPSRGIDFPCIGVDIKAIKVRRGNYMAAAQATSVFKSFREAIYGLSYDLIIFFYHLEQQTLTFETVKFVKRENARDFALVTAIHNILTHPEFLTREEVEDRINDLFYEKFNADIPQSLLQEIITRGVHCECEERRPVLTMAALTQWRLYFNKID